MIESIILAKSAASPPLSSRPSVLFSSCHLDQALARGALGYAAWLVQEISLSRATPCKLRCLDSARHDRAGQVLTDSNKQQKNTKIFGSFKISSYLCSVKNVFLTTPLSAGSKPLSTLLHLKATLLWLLFFISFTKYFIKERTQCEITVNRYQFLSFKYQYFYCFRIYLKISSDIRCQQTSIVVSIDIK